MTVDRPWRIGLRVLGLGYLALLLLVPVGLIFYRTFEHGVGAVWDSITTPAAIHAFQLTLEVTAIAVPLNTVFSGTAITVTSTVSQNAWIAAGVVIESHTAPIPCSNVR